MSDDVAITMVVHWVII